MSRPVEATIIEVEQPDEVWNRDGFIVVELITGERLKMQYGPDAKGALPKVGQKTTLSNEDFITLQGAQPQPLAPDIDPQSQSRGWTWDEDPFGASQSTYSKPGGVVLIVVFNLLLFLVSLFLLWMILLFPSAMLIGVIFFVIAVFLLVVSIGLYKLQSWARKAYMIFCVLFCFTIYGAIIGIPVLIYLYGDVKNSFD